MTAWAAMTPREMWWLRWLRLTQALFLLGIVFTFIVGSLEMMVVCTFYLVICDTVWKFGGPDDPS